MPSDADETLWLRWAEKDTRPIGASETNTPFSSRSTTSNSNGKGSKKLLRVLLRIDEQNDFMPGGALAVADGDQIVDVSNRLALSGYYDLVVDSMDDHPVDHGSFASQHDGKKPLADKVSLHGIDQQLWPDHCVSGTQGAEFHPKLDRSMVAMTIKKGQDKRVDSYSAFYDNGRHAKASDKKQNQFLGQSTGLADYLRQCAEEREATAIQIDIVGLALPFCVTYSAKDAREELYKGRPFDVRVIADGVKAIELQDGDFERSLADLKKSDIEIITSKDVLSELAAKR